MQCKETLEEYYEENGEKLNKYYDKKINSVKVSTNKIVIKIFQKKNKQMEEVVIEIFL